MKKAFFVIAFLSLIFLIGCTTPSDEEKTKIGVIVPLSGPLAEYGVAMQNGLVLAKENLGAEASGFELIFEDSQYDPKIAVLAYTKLSQVDEVDFVVVFGSPTSEAIAPIVDSQRVPMVSTAIATEIPKESPFIVRGLDRPEAYTVKTLEYLREQNISRIGMVKAENSYIQYLYDSLLESKLPEEKIVLIDNYTLGDNDFRASLLKIKESDVEAIGVFLGSGQISLFYKQATELGVNLPTFGTDFFESQTEIDNADGAMEEAIYANNEVDADFKESYRNRFGNESQIVYAGYSYDLFRIMVKKGNFESPEKFMESLKNVKDFEGILGPTSYTEKEGDRYFQKPVYMKKIENNEITTIT
ncbi:ABC transporter substrate-binding protein [Candidatus Micrarchaeota archaeon]|nr:ABC transporter substrate-binding protein [Candidatus Micrarchaeota archaeon]MBU1930603.1 ABC transporter substrate-binding protein [Candidatus Micrarchaeota archaeon]